MELSELVTMVLGLLQGMAAAAIFLLALMIGLALGLDFVKLRASKRLGYARNLDDAVGEAAHGTYLPPDAPRGVVDQLRPHKAA